MINYQNIIKNRSTRVRILKLFSWLPDEVMVKLQYRIKFGRKLNLKDPKRFTEKIQWYKLFYHDPKMTQCAGKNHVRDYITSKGLGYILNERYGVYEKAEEIDFDSLPNRFVIKATIGAASQTVFVCLDKSKYTKEDIINKISGWIPKDSKKTRKNSGREWAYYNVKPEYVVEKYIDSSSCPNGLLSYKIFCFNGKPQFVYLIADIKEGFFDADYGIVSTSYEKLPYVRVGAEHLELKQRKPENFDEMIHIAEILSGEFPHVRVDLYNVNGKIIFGEMTFYNDSGYMRFDPDEFDYIAGDMFKLPEKRI